MQAHKDELGSFRHAAVIQFRGAPVEDFYFSLGFVTCTAREEPSPGYMAALTGGEVTRATIAKFVNQSGSVIEIVTLETESVKRVAMWNHIAITVAECAAKIRELEDVGGVLIGGPVQSPDGPYIVAYVRDASGNLVELVQPLDSVK